METLKQSKIGLEIESDTEMGYMEKENLKEQLPMKGEMASIFAKLKLSLKTGGGKRIDLTKDLEVALPLAPSWSPQAIPYHTVPKELPSLWARLRMGTD